MNILNSSDDRTERYIMNGTLFFIIALLAIIGVELLLDIIIKRL